MHYLDRYFVEYIDEYGQKQAEYWNQETMDEELECRVVTITRIDIAYPILAAGLVDN